MQEKRAAGKKTELAKVERKHYRSKINQTNKNKLYSFVNRTKLKIIAAILIFFHSFPFLTPFLLSDRTLISPHLTSSLAILSSPLLFYPILSHPHPPLFSTSSHAENLFTTPSSPFPSQCYLTHPHTCRPPTHTH